MKFSIKDFLGKCDQIRSFLRIWSPLLKKSLMENFIFCAVSTIPIYSHVFIVPWDNHNEIENNSVKKALMSPLASLVFLMVILNE